MDKIFEVSGPVQADVELASGSAAVHLVAGLGTAKVHMEPRTSRHADRSEAAIADSTVELRGDELVVHVPGRRNVDILMVLELPDGSGLSGRVASADVSVSGGTLSSADLKSASGDVRLGDVTGRASVTTASGEMSLGEVGGELSTTTASGDVRVRAARGDVRAKTASGDVEIATLGDNSPEVVVNTASGDITIGEAGSGSIKVNTASGDVTLGIAEGAGAWLDLTTVSGGTVCNLPEERQGAAAAALKVTCRTVSGDITVRHAVAAR